MGEDIKWPDTWTRIPHHNSNTPRNSVPAWTGQKHVFFTVLQRYDFIWLYSKCWQTFVLEVSFTPLFVLLSSLWARGYECVQFSAERNVSVKTIILWAGSVPQCGDKCVFRWQPMPEPEPQQWDECGLIIAGRGAPGSPGSSPSSRLPSPRISSLFSITLRALCVLIKVMEI